MTRRRAVGPAANVSRPPWDIPDSAREMWSLELPCDRWSVPVFRRRAGVVLAEWDVTGPEHGDALLLVSELVTNSVKFGRCQGNGNVRLDLWRLDRRLLVIESSDESGGWPLRQDAAPAGPAAILALAESGRGLGIVAGISQDWGWYEPRPGWKTVYCTMRIPGGAVTGGARPGYGNAGRLPGRGFTRHSQQPSGTEGKDCRCS